MALAALSLASPSTVLGLPAAIVVGVRRRSPWCSARATALVAVTGAVVFGLLNRWGTGGLAALGEWPLVVIATGWFARQVARQRQVLFRTVLEGDERKRGEVAGDLHDGIAQTLSGALLALAQRGDDGAREGGNAGRAASTSPPATRRAPGSWRTFRCLRRS